MKKAKLLYMSKDCEVSLEVPYIAYWIMKTFGFKWDGNKPLLKGKQFDCVLFDEECMWLSNVNKKL